MTIRQNESLLKTVIAQLELPEKAYAKAISRYEDLGEWMGRDESRCATHGPHIFPQGSFRLGTAIRPLHQEEEYDLDLACNLTVGISTSSHSQQDLKDMVGLELEKYRVARGIQAQLDEKYRCWRLEYADDLSFHMDIVPCIPEGEIQRSSLVLAMESHGMDPGLAISVAERAVGITDTRHQHYEVASSDWMISNPEGYATWFESRMQERLEMRVAMEAAQVDEVPLYKRKKPLQRVIQLLKRHRDKMFISKPDSKPISVIISTLAAQSYSGSVSLEVALRDVLSGFNKFVSSGEDVVSNPVNPKENFADRWHMPQYQHLHLKQNFSNWVYAVTRDFEFILVSTETAILCESLSQSLGVKLSEDSIQNLLGITVTATATAPQQVAQAYAKPWLGEE